MFVYYIVGFLSILLYLHGFFPIPTKRSTIYNEANTHQTKSTYEKTVIIVIDALRLDFVNETNTPFLWKSMKTAGCFNKLKVESPTVTLPRIKALVTGNVPQFVDIVLNLANPTAVDDSLVHRARARNLKIVFYGDNTWLKLFPHVFERSEGTNSFFVSDYTEVDDNVTRNVRLEVQRSDWDIMILHYLGLDHIGHVFGPKSPLVPVKLQEMDNIVQEVSTFLPSKSLILVTGDHGMRDSGGHGGSTFPETHVPLVVIGSPCSDGAFNQIDIASNLAVLLNLDIPATSIGQLQPNLLQHLPLEQFLNALRHNVFLLKDKLNLCTDPIQNATQLHDEFLLYHHVNLGLEAARIYMECSQQISESLVKASVKQNIGSLLTAIAGVVYALLKIGLKLLNVEAPPNELLEQGIVLSVLLLQLVNVHSILTLTFATTLTVLCLRNLALLKIKRLKRPKLAFIPFMLVVHPFIFFSSSFIEEEHQFWYFSTGTYVLLELLESKNKVSWFMVFGALRFIRSINQVGDKWASSPDLADWLMQNENYFYLQTVFVLGLCLTLYASIWLGDNTTNLVITGAVLFVVFLYKTVTQDNVILIKLAWCLIFGKLFYCKLKKLHGVTVWVLIITLLVKPYNVILIPFCIGTSLYYKKTVKDARTLTLFDWWLGNLLFFAQGHDNSLASVHISSGYIGLSEYNPLLVFPQVLCHTYAFPVLCNLLISKYHKIETYFPVFVVLRLYVLLMVLIVTVLLRQHISIWSVFCPKLFVEAGHFTSLLIQITCFCVNKTLSFYESLFIWCLVFGFVWGRAAWL